MIARAGVKQETHARREVRDALIDNPHTQVGPKWPPPWRYRRASGSTGKGVGNDQVEPAFQGGQQARSR